LNVIIFLWRKAFSLGGPDDFSFTVTGNSPEPDEFLGNPDCAEISIGPSEYAVSEVNMFGGALLTPSIEGECMQDPSSR
jgi:hypothetical protein